MCSFMACSSDTPRLLLNQSQILVNENQYVAAQLLLKQIIEDYPDSDEAVKAKADIFYINKRLEKDLNGRIQSTQKSLDNIITAINRYSTDKKKLPRNLNELYPYYLNQIPLDGWGHPFFYTPSENLKDGSYRLFSMGAASKPIPFDQLDSKFKN